MSGYGKRAMHHGDIRVTMNVYGEPVNDAFKDASSKFAERALRQLLTKAWISFLNLGWETGIEPATVGATVRCSAS
jgi:hypothetical protein